MSEDKAKIHPETDWHGEHNGQWWHFSKPPESRPLEPCKCLHNENKAGLPVSDELYAALEEWDGRLIAALDGIAPEKEDRAAWERLERALEAVARLEREHIERQVKSEIIHMKETIGYDPFAVCGAIVLDEHRLTNWDSWDDVTCKRCLKKRHDR